MLQFSKGTENDVYIQNIHDIFMLQFSKRTEKDVYINIVGGARKAFIISCIGGTLNYLGGGHMFLTKPLWYQFIDSQKLKSP